MKKLRLDLDGLRVDSFQAEAGSTQQRGTVHARVPYTHPGWCPPSADVYCSYGDCTIYQEFTCGGTGCMTWEAQYCYRPTEIGNSCTCP